VTSSVFFPLEFQEWYRTLAEQRREIQQEMDLDEERFHPETWGIFQVILRFSLW
jgi:hypothetical protein